MKRNRVSLWNVAGKVTAIGVLSLGLVLLAQAALPEGGGGYDLSWFTIDGGGEMFSTGGGYELSGTIGQHDAGEMAGGSYTLTGGFWAASPCPTPELLTVCKDDVPAKAKKDVYVWPVDPAFAAGGLTSVSIELNMDVSVVDICVKNTGAGGPTTAELVAEGPVGCYSVVFDAPIEL